MVGLGGGPGCCHLPGKVAQLGPALCPLNLLRVNKLPAGMTFMADGVVHMHDRFKSKQVMYACTAVSCMGPSRFKCSWPSFCKPMHASQGLLSYTHKMLQASLSLLITSRRGEEGTFCMRT